MKRKKEVMNEKAAKVAGNEKQKLAKNGKLISKSGKEAGLFPKGKTKSRRIDYVVQNSKQHGGNECAEESSDVRCGIK